MQQRTGAEGVLGSARDGQPAAEAANAAADPLKLYKSVDGYRAIMEWYESLVEKIGVPFEALYVNTRFGRTHLLAAGPKEAPALFLMGVGPMARWNLLVKI